MAQTIKVALLNQSVVNDSNNLLFSNIHQLSFQWRDLPLASTQYIAEGSPKRDDSMPASLPTLLSAVVKDQGGKLMAEDTG